MINISTLNIGDKVHYISHEGATPENGMVKEIPDHTNTEIRVVYHCGGEWNNFMDYTSQLTPINKLELGWNHKSEQDKIDAYYAEDDYYDSAQYLK